MITDEDTSLLGAFECDFPSETACLSFVREFLAEEGNLICHKCKSVQVEQFKKRTVRCIDCGKQSWFTAGTIFERAKKLRPFLALLWFEAHGRPLSSCAAEELLEIAQSSAWVMKKKIEIALLSGSLSTQASAVAVQSEAFALAIRKRSRETPAREHPRAEIELSRSGSSDEIAEQHQNNLQDSTFGHLPPDQQRVLDVLAKAETAVHIDKLAELTDMSMNQLFLALTYLEFAKLIRTEGMARYTVDRIQAAYLATQSDAPVTPESLERRVEAFIAFCHRAYHGISRKYLQLYLSSFTQTRDIGRESFVDSVRFVLKHAPIGYAEIINFISPPAVTLLLQL